MCHTSLCQFCDMGNSHLGKLFPMEVFSFSLINPIALRKTKIAYNFGLSECSRARVYGYSK